MTRIRGGEQEKEDDIEVKTSTFLVVRLSNKLTDKLDFSCCALSDPIKD